MVARSVLDNYVKRATLEQNEFLFEEGMEGNFISILLTGNLNIMKKSITGKMIKVSSLGPGMSVGEMSIIDKMRRSATVQAVTPSELFELSKENFEALINTHSALGIKLLRGIARSMSLNLRRASNRLADCLPPIV